MRPSTSPSVRAAHRIVPLAVLLAVGTFPAAPTALASSARHAPAGVSPVLLKVQVAGPRGYTPFSPSKPSVTRIATGRPARIVLYAYFTGVTAPLRVRVTFFRRRARATLVLESAGTFRVGRAQLGGTSGWRWYWDDIVGIIKKPGRLTFRGVISAGGVTQVRETRLTVL